MQRYDSYKDSGVQWLGEIPSHWEVVRNKFLFKENDERNSQRRYQLLSFSKKKGIIPFADMNDKECSSEDLSNYKILHKGQLLENRLQAWNGMFGVSKIEGCVSPDYSVFDVVGDNVDINYVGYLFTTPLYIEQWANASKGVGSGFNRLYTPQFNNVECLLPPLPEQQAIASYLDTATAKIDEAIAQQQKMIDLLNERKQIIINNAVTKGLNPNAKMKPSGIDWIGNIPEHWEVNKLKNCAKTNSGSTPRSIAGKENPTSTIRWVRTTDLHNNIVEDTSEYISEKEMASANCPWLPKGTVLISMYGGSGSFGKVGLLNIEATINQALCSIICNSSISPMYMFYYLQSVHRIWMKYAASSRKDPNLNQETIRNLDVVVPPLEEQECIINAIQEKLKSIGTVIEIFEHQILLLQERKQIIINDVVTGKVKVL